MARRHKDSQIVPSSSLSLFHPRPAHPIAAAASNLIAAEISLALLPSKKPSCANFLRALIVLLSSLHLHVQQNGEVTAIPFCLSTLNTDNTSLSFKPFDTNPLRSSIHQCAAATIQHDLCCNTNIFAQTHSDCRSLSSDLPASEFQPSSVPTQSRSSATSQHFVWYIPETFLSHEALIFCTALHGKALSTSDDISSTPPRSD